MRVVIRWSPRSQRRLPLPAPSAAPEERFQHLLKIAHAAPAFASSQRPLDSLPPVSLDEYWARPHAFQHPKHPLRLARVQYPLSPTPRIAIIASGFAENQNTLCFPHGWSHALRDFRPEALAGPVSALRRLAKSVFNRGASFPHLKRPILVFTGFAFNALELFTDEDRELLWKAFRVPLYEQFLGLSHELLFTECDAHHGLHLLSDRTLVSKSPDGELLLSSLSNLAIPIPKIATGLNADLDLEPCPCGQPGLRLHSLRPVPAAVPVSLRNLAMAGD